MLPAPIMSETPVYCPKCGVGNHPMNYRCQSCGTVLPQSQQPGQPQQPNPYAQQNPYYQQPQVQNPYYQSQPSNPPFPKPNSGLVGAIIATVLFCVPLGIVALINASKVDSEWAEGKWDDAQRHAKNAQTFTWVSVAVGLVFSILYFIVLVAAES